MTCAELTINKLKEKYTDDRKLDVAFICYNASMWDSLESVYLLAEEMWNVEVVCPFYMSGKSIKSDVYDMPSGVRCSTALVKEHYDIIFNNNPYDDRNLVTRLQTDYWNTSLAEKCDTLVMIPYFCNPNEVEENIVLSNGYLVADLVIVDSEKVREYCCDVLHKFFLERGRDLDFHEKIFAFGSPKYDKIDNDIFFELPKEWNDIIADRKVILLNTSLKPFLQNPNKINDIRYVLNRFKNNSEYVVLWRPHPLMISTIENLRPNQINDYLDIVEWVKETKCAIYDDSSDLYRAIVLSDLMISDESSLIYIYEKTNKPINMLDDFIKEKNLKF